MLDVANYNFKKNSTDNIIEILIIRAYDINVITFFYKRKIELNLFDKYRFIKVVIAKIMKKKMNN